jgi:FkbM family methyltransferase
MNWPLPRGKGILTRLFQPCLRDRAFLMKVEPGIFVPAELDDYVLWWGFMHGYDSEPCQRLSRQLLLPGDTVVDVGANIGLWAMGAARRLGTTGQLHAFEPEPGNYARLVRNLKLNQLEQVHHNQLALSDQEGGVTFFAAQNGNSGMGGLSAREGVDRAIRVECTTLERYCERQGIERIDFIKLDIEGAEQSALLGATRFLAAPDGPALMFEADDSLAAALGNSTQALKTLLARHGYQLFSYDGRALREINPESKHEHEDILAFKPHHRTRHRDLFQSIPLIN